MKIEINKERFYFGFRFEGGLKKRIVHYCNSNSLSLNELVKEAVENLFRLHDKKQLMLNESVSAFSARKNLRDRVDTMLILPAVIRELVWNFSVCYRRSMAEIIRIALELMLDSRDSEKSKSGNIKHYYSIPQTTIECTIIGLYPIYPPSPP